MADELETWKDGAPVLPVEDSSMLALKYWADGSPYVMTFVTAAGGADIAKVNNIALASISKYNGIAKASVAKINGLSIS